MNCFLSPLSLRKSSEIQFSNNMIVSHSMKQLNLFEEKLTREFGGTLNKGRRKNARPLDTKRSLHLVLKCTNPFLLLRRRAEIEKEIYRMCRRFGLKIYRIAIQADHIHLSVRVPSRILYFRWIRGLTSSLVRKASGLKFALRPYSRIVSWGREFKAICNYIFANFQEGDFILHCHLRVERWRQTAWDWSNS